MNSLLRYLLLPFAWLYGLVVFIRNLLFDWQILKSESFDVPLIGIGNLSTGGTGKTPMAEYVLKLLLENGYKPALLSRGYGRETRGFIEVKPDSYTFITGDEPYQVKKKFPEAYVAVCEDRALGIKNILLRKPKTDVIVLDDSFQHRYVKPGLNILLTDYKRPYSNDFLLPAGRLREPVSGRKRADIIIVTKSPKSIDDEYKVKIRRKLKAMPRQEVYFTSIEYQPLQNVNTNESLDFNNNLWKRNMLLFTGIANVAPLEKFLYKGIGNFYSIKYPDHHDFSIYDYKEIRSIWKTISGDDKIMVTTEKDWRRIEGNGDPPLYSNLPLYFLPIAVEWDPEEKPNFDKTVLDYVQGNRTGS